MTRGTLTSSLQWVVAAVLWLLTLASNAQAGTEKVLYAFQGGSDGGGPTGGLIWDKAGNLYGTTRYGGNLTCGVQYGCGTVFELKHTKNGWQEEVLYSFAGGSDGATPYAGLTMDRKGQLYGTTISGGGNGCRGLGCGMVFRLAHASNGAWRETVLHRFNKFKEGQNPYAGVILDPHGNLYGITYGGGQRAGGCDVGCGVVFQLTPDGRGKWNQRVLYSLAGSGNSSASLVFDNAGNLYGTTVGCDGCSNGEVFMLTHHKRTWAGSALFVFGGGYGGWASDAALVLDNSGNIYGTTPYGGGGQGFGCGTVFELTSNSGGHWTENVLYGFNGGMDGIEPEAPLIFGQDGSLYGTTEWGGGSTACGLGCGTVFKLTPSGTGWSETVLYRFKGGSDGDIIYSGVILDKDSNLYGIAAGGGAYGGGVVYEITP